MSSSNKPSATSVSVYSTYSKNIRPGEDLVETVLTIPPDGGWGWVIVPASFFCCFVVDGSMYSFGLFLEDIGQSLDVQPTTVSLGSSLLTGVYFLLGPVICALVNRFGFQAIGVSGGILASIAFFFSSLSNSIGAFLTILGGIGGFGFGMVYVASVVVVGFYFEKWRSVATSITVTGSAAGIVIFPLVMDNLLEKLSWRDKFRIIGGLCLCTSCLSLLYRPLKPVRVLTKDATIVQIINEPDESAISLRPEKKLGFFKRLFHQFHNITFPTAAEVHRDSTIVINLSTASSTSSVFIMSVPEGSSTTFAKADGRSERLDKLSTVYECDNATEGKWKTRCRKCCCDYKCCKACFGEKYKNRPMYRDDILYTASVFTLPARSASRPSQMQQKAKSMEYAMSVTRVELTKLEGERFHCKCCPESIVRILVTMMNFQLLKSPSLLLLAFSGFFTLLGLYVPFIYLVQRAEEIGVSKDDSIYLFTALGVANAVGRTVSGVITIIPQAKPLPVSYITLFICGVSTILSYFLTSLAGQYVYVIVFGLTMASYVSLRPPIIVQLLGLERLTNAFGLMMLFQGVAALIGIPVAGKIVEASEQYSSSFIFSGCAITISAILLIPIDYVAKWEQKKAENVDT